MMFDIEIKETLRRVVSVEADCIGDAEEKVTRAYRNEDIVLDADDMWNLEINGVDY